MALGFGQGGASSGAASGPAEEPSDGVEVSVRDLQRALTQAHRSNSAIPSPGAIDGVWGSHTQTSANAWERTLPEGLDIYGVSDDYRNVSVSQPMADRIRALASQYGATSAASSNGGIVANRSATVPAIVSASRSNWWVWAVVGLGVVGLAAALWWHFKRGRRS